MPASKRTPYAVRLLRAHVTGLTAPAFDLVEPDGERHRVGAAHVASAFTLSLRTERAWRALGSLDETRIAEAYLRGDIDFEGSMLAALDLRGFLSDRHPFASLWRFIQPWLYGNVGADKSWVPQHYDYGNEFSFAFLDRKFRLYSQAVYASEEKWAGAHLHRDGGLQAYRLVFQKGKSLPSRALGLAGPGVAPV